MISSSCHPRQDTSCPILYTAKHYVSNVSVLKMNGPVPIVGIWKIFFCLRGHNRKIYDIMRAFNPIVPQSRTFQPAQKNVSSLLVLTYYPGLPDLKCLLRQFHPILQASTRMAEMFPKIPMVVFRRPQNLRKHLVRAKVNHLRNFVPPSCCPRNRPRYQLCSLIPECTYIVSHTTGQKRYIVLLEPTVQPQT